MKQNYVQFFRQAEEATYMQACVVYVHFNTVMFAAVGMFAAENSSPELRLVRR